MIKNLYTIASGFSGKKLSNKLTLIALAIIYLFTLAFIGLFYEITWLSKSIPGEILFGGYRYIQLSMFSSILSFLFIVMFLVEIYWLNVQSDVFFNKTTARILTVSGVSGRKIYSAYFIKRCLDLFFLNLIFVLPLFLLFALRDGAFPLVLLENIYILFYGSVLLLVLYDLFYYLTKKSSATSIVTILAIIIFPLISFMFRPMIVEYYPGSVGPKLLHLIPDVLSIGYQYVLYSFSSAYSLSKIFYPAFFLAISLICIFFLSKRMLVRFSV